MKACCKMQMMIALACMPDEDNTLDYLAVTRASR